MDRSLRRAALGIAAWKIVCLAFVASLSRLWPSFNLGNYAANFHWPPDAAPSFKSLFATWDAQHFLYLSREGYQPGALSNNFFPLWPWLIQAAGGGLAASLLLSNFLSLIALLLFYAHTRETKNELLARHSLLLLLAYPGAFFLCLPFSESLFLLLVMLLFVGLAKNKISLYAPAAFLLPLCRPQGILVAVPYWYGLWRQDKKRFEHIPLWLLPLAGGAAYLFFMLHATGDAFDGLKTYRDIFPQNPSLMKMLDPVGFAKTLFEVTAWHDVRGSLLDRLWFVLFACCLPPLWKRDRLLFFYALPMGLVPAASLGFVSYTRHLLLVFPVFIVLAEFFEQKPPALRWAVLSALAAFQLYLLARHANNFWVA